MKPKEGRVEFEIGKSTFFRVMNIRLATSQFILSHVRVSTLWKHQHLVRPPRAHDQYCGGLGVTFQTGPASPLILRARIGGCMRATSPHWIYGNYPRFPFASVYMLDLDISVSMCTMHTSSSVDTRPVPQPMVTKEKS